MAKSAAFDGVSLIGFHGGGKGKAFRGVDPRSGAALDGEFHAASAADVDEAVRLAGEAFPVYGNLSGRDRAQFLRQVASGLEAEAESIVSRASLETGLTEPRIQGELARTVRQLRLFAQVAEEGSWVEARLDSPDPDRKPTPKPDLRSMLRPLGPVAVFGASNFPLAYSVAGGDTASALASGCPVIVKAHPAHPGTSELVGRVLVAAVKAQGLPEGTFSMLFDDGIAVGEGLVRHPGIAAVGFTGSQSGGKALMKLAAERPAPIPVYAEMGSVNPVFILPEALRKRGVEIAAGLEASVTLGAGQFCTKPGMVFHPMEPTGFSKDLAARISETSAQTMLTAGIASRYSKSVAEREQAGTTETAARGGEPAGSREGASGRAVLFTTDYGRFLKDGSLAKEVFGPSTLLIAYGSRQELIDAANGLEGHLTATIHAEPGELEQYADLVEILSRKAGRLIINGYPTGVEVGDAIVHGGPFPSTSDGRSTSVGSRAIRRFGRLVCYQNFPESALPDALKQSNPLVIWRMINGQWLHSQN